MILCKTEVIITSFTVNIYNYDVKGIVKLSTFLLWKSFLQDSLWHLTWKEPKQLTTIKINKLAYGSFKGWF